MKRLLLSLLSTGSLIAQQTPTPAAAEWWRITTALSNDSMQGRDTGTQAYERAAYFVADHFATDHLKPAGDDSGFFQRVPMHQVSLDIEHSSIELLSSNSKTRPLPIRLLYETTLSPRAGLPPEITGDLFFLGYGLTETSPDLRGKVVIFFSKAPASIIPTDRASYLARRAKFLAESGAAAIVSIDDPAAIEPFHWPAAYARTVTLSPAIQLDNQPVMLRMSEEAAVRLFVGAPIDPKKLFASAAAGQPISSSALPQRLRIRLKTTEKDISSPNILAILPGSDPSLAPEYVALSAHLDGYGFGTPVLGDSLYNGALDDAAYVATLLELAHTLAHTPPKRSLLFCIFTGEEKGLLGSEYFTEHPTVAAGQIVADLNLDQLRPIFPLRILTMEGIDDSTLGETARAVAARFSIQVRPDREPDRNLFRRADNYNFVRIGVPIAGFIFGYDPGTPEEAAYRNWYATRYHKPQDDLSTPIDWTAAVKFNDFYRVLATTVADAPKRPEWLPASPNAPQSGGQAKP